MLANYLFESDHYLTNIDNNDIDDLLLNIPEKYLLYDEPTSYKIEDINDFKRKLDIFEYWRTDGYPNCYYQFIMDNYKLFNIDLLDELFDKYKIDLKLIIDIFIKQNNDNISLIIEFIKIGNLEWIKWIYQSLNYLFIFFIYLFIHYSHFPT